MRVLGARRPASGDGGVDDEPTRPLPRRSRRARLALRVAKVLVAVVLILAAGIGLLFVLTPSAGQATALAAAQAREHHIAYPGPPVPRYFAEALVATEDHRFYTDPGVDPFALVRVAGSWITGHTDGGGSTIDQQLAKNLYTSGHSSFVQIVEQVTMAVKLNRTYSRAEILRLYAEIAYYGHGYYGLDAASCGYFGRPPAELTVVQAAMLAGAVNAPTYDDPLVYPAQARARLVHVIDRMAAVGYLTKAQQAAALNAPLGLSAARGCQ
ncbi:MAG TPA: biosynthetic peptidoglycan transglycosylase [Streptosporangiaceae bacterium]|nr:biosynthetic peptidoglycan transglycosylase [Streptosporangiaceae bacterium]